MNRKTSRRDGRRRAQKIRVILFDVDGVLTDGTIWFFPAPPASARNTDVQAHHKAGSPGFGIVSQNLIEAKGFHAHDGTAISLAHLGGLKAGVVTKRVSETVALRARDLKMDFVFQGAENKSEVLDKILEEAGIRENEVCYVGDDVIDLPIMRRCGLAIAVANARAEILQIAHYVTPSCGGAGAGRDAVEFILKAQGKFEQVIEAYIYARSSVKD